MREHVSRQKKTTTGFSIPSLKHPTRGFGLESSAISRQAIPEIQPLHKPVTHDISRIPLRSQAKLSISQPGDIYEQEADSVAQQVMQRMAQPVNRQSIQREALPESEEELQMKPLANSITPLVQREQVPEDESELQKSPMVQCQSEGGMATTPDLEASINQARGGGQLMADNIRQPMEQAFGADFSRVKVHTDGQSDQLNRSIQARAFATGQDVFFRQGEYNPGSRGGQELLAHELTHVVQQNGGAVQRSALPSQQLPQHPATETPSAPPLQRAPAAHYIPVNQSTDLGGTPSLVQRVGYDRADGSCISSDVAVGANQITMTGDLRRDAISVDPIQAHLDFTRTSVPLAKVDNSALGAAYRKATVIEIKVVDASPRSKRIGQILAYHLGLLAQQENIKYIIARHVTDARAPFYTPLAFRDAMDEPQWADLVNEKNQIENTIRANQMVPNLQQLLERQQEIVGLMEANTIFISTANLIQNAYGAFSAQWNPV
ncbi:eCIS core domain-containing protein [Nostoc sp.]|uniref:eCIS core domain-containing protein n=1 Tax=Nostoc sp. TaxID=1180 RepID=UPI002FF7C9FB